MFSNAEECNFELNTIAKIEPRLVEYIKKKKFYKENNIDDHLIEKEFNISKYDILKIKNYFKGNKAKKYTDYTEMVEPDRSGFASDELKKDHRFERLKIKQKRDKEAKEQRGNYDIMAREYDMYRDDRKFASAYGNDFKTRFNPEVWFENNNENQDIESDEEMENPNELNRKSNKKNTHEQSVSDNEIVDMRRRYSNPNIYKHVTPKIRNKDRVTWGCNDDLATKNYSLDSIMNNLDKHNNNVTKKAQISGTNIIRHKRSIDQSSNNIIPENTNIGNGQYGNINKSQNKNSQENNYYIDTKTNNKKMKDVGIENYLCYGNGPSRGAKSLGYPNPAEHYFQYISDDISKQEHTIFEPGMSSRLFNKDTARPNNNRDILR
jgi:hypothetical protein